MGDTFDYIVAGGGTCGPVIAARLTEDPNVSVLIVEAGQDSKDMDDMHMAGAWTKNFDKETDWNIITPPNPGLNGRECRLPRGRFFGGSSGCNGTICVRGVKQDYDDWGFPEWSGDEMFRCMRKAETFHPQEWFPHDESAHGFDGPLHIEPAQIPPFGYLFLESYKSKGLPYHPDMFSSGVTANGCGHAMRTTYLGTRTTGADYITKDKARPNVHIKYHTIVDNVILEKEGSELVAKGVNLIDEQGNKSQVFAKKEVVLTGGTYCSPAMLLRSGIGPKADLEGLGITCVKDLPGVGKNLQDHQLIFTYYEVNRNDLTDDARVSHDPNAYENGHKEWKENKTGWLATFPFGSFAFARLSERIDKENEWWRNLKREPGRDPMGLTETQPNLEFFHTVCYGGPKEYIDFPKEGQYAFAMCCFLCGMQSRGEVKLKSKDPLENPMVDHRYLSDKRDLVMMSEGVRFANEVVLEGAGTKDVIKGSWPEGAKHHLNKTNEDWQPHVQRYASTSYHPAGTCKMGPSSDPMAVLDQGLRVYGTKNLRVADCSMMPLVHSGHTQMPAYGIAERAAEMIKADAAGRA